MLAIAMFALFAFALGLLFVARRSLRFVGLALAICAAGLLALHLRAAGHDAMQLESEIARRDSLVGQYCRSLAFQLLSEVNDYRTLTKGDSDPLPIDALKLQNYYLHSLSERRQFARLCIASGTEEAQWFACIPQALSEQTLARIEHAATAIQERKPCD